MYVIISQYNFQATFQWANPKKVQMIWYNEEEPPTSKAKKVSLMENVITVGAELSKFFMKAALFLVQRTTKTHSGNDYRYGTKWPQQKIADYGKLEAG